MIHFVWKSQGKWILQSSSNHLLQTDMATHAFSIVFTNYDSYKNTDFTGIKLSFEVKFRNVYGSTDIFRSIFGIDCRSQHTWIMVDCDSVVHLLQDPKRHLEEHVNVLMTSNIVQCLGAMLHTVVFK